MFSNWWKNSWKGTFNDFWLMFGISLLVTFIIFLIVSILGFLPFISIPMIVVLQSSLGYVFYLKHKGKMVRIDDVFVGENKVFSSVDSFFRLTGGILWKYLWLFLWALIPVAGIFISIFYKRYQYFITELLLNKYPKMRECDALKLSMEMTKGYKKAMFVMDIVFYGLLLLLMAGVSLFWYLVSIDFNVIYLLLALLFSLILFGLRMSIVPMFYNTYRAICFDEILLKNEYVVDEYFRERSIKSAMYNL